MTVNANQTECTKGLISFIESSPTAFQAVESAARILTRDGFTALRENEQWNLTPGKGYFVTRNRSSVIAFRLPEAGADKFMIAASHTDSPMFKLKNENLSSAFDEYLRLNTEVYGGTILSTWLDRPLGLAGRVILCENGEFRTVNYESVPDLVLIPNVAIHFNREVNRGYAFNPAVDMMPLFAQAKKGERTVASVVAKDLGCDESAIVGMDLYVCNRQKGCVWGADGEFFSAPRIDNLMCAYGTLEGFRAAKNASAVTVWYAADNEETGSATKQGAGSEFLSDVIDRICASLGLDRFSALASSMMVSADNGHAKHPNHPEFSDAQNSPKLNGGVVIKCNAAQKYTTDAISASIFTEICKRAGVPVQQYANRSDLPGGSTLGSISNTQVPLITVDIGMAQLAMHSSFETAGCADTEALIRASEQFFNSNLIAEDDGRYRLNP